MKITESEPSLTEKRDLCTNCSQRFIKNCSGCNGQTKYVPIIKQTQIKLELCY